MSQAVSTVETLACYVAPSSRRLLREAAEREARGEQAPDLARGQAALLMTDISGFTALTERLLQQGEIGAERLGRALNVYFGEMIDLIDAAGGEILKFSGDGLLALWPVAAPSADPEDALAACVRRAAACGLRLQQALNGHRPLPGIALTLRIGIGAGELVLGHVGGGSARLDLALCGPGLEQVLAAGNRGQPGEIILSPRAFATLQPVADGAPLPDGFFRLLAVTSPRGVPDSTSGEGSAPPDRSRQETASGSAVADELARLRRCIPAEILDRIDAGHSGWLTELRRITALFVLLDGLDEAALGSGRAHAAVRMVQRCVARYGGSINKLHIDEKGAMVLVVFGLPGRSYEDDAVRGIQTALECETGLSALGWPCAIGVASGPAFCGTVGNAVRCEYTVLGDTVNLAARLMSAARKVGRPVLCEGQTREAADAHVDFAAALTLALKGKSQLMQVYAPVGGSRPADQRRRSRSLATSLLGRTDERAEMEGHIRALKEARGGTVLIEGEGGIGKSRFIAAAAEYARRLGVRTLIGGGDAIERLTAYSAWSGILRDLLGLPGAGSPIAAGDVSARLQPLGPELVGQAELLRTLLQTDRESAGWLGAMESRAHAEKYDALLLLLLARASEQEPLLVILEDAQWLDSASFRLVQRVQARGLRLLLTVVSRPASSYEDAGAQAQYEAVRGASGVRCLTLRALLPEETAALACERLGVASLPAEVIEFICERSGGHPLFCEEIALALRDHGALRIAERSKGKEDADRDREGLLLRTPEELRMLRIPATLHGALTSRIDRLRPPHHLSLKVASVVGRSFPYAALQYVYPVTADRPYLGEYMEALQRQDFIVHQEVPRAVSYAFRHALVQEAAYNMLSFSQRHQLHRGVADWYESAQEQQAASACTVIAQHLAAAAESEEAAEGELSRAIRYLLRAAEHAIHRGALRESQAFCDRAQGFLARLPEGPEQQRHRLEVLLLRAMTLANTQGYSVPEVEQSYEESLSLCQALGEQELLRPTLFGLWNVNLWRGRHFAACTYASQLLHLSADEADAGAALAAHSGLVLTCFFLGEFEASQEHAQQVLARLETDHPERTQFITGVELETLCRGYSTHSLWALGQPEEAMRQSRDNIARARQRNHPYSLVFAYAAALICHCLASEPLIVQELAREQMALAEQHGYVSFVMQARFFVAWALAQQGERAAGSRHIEEAVAFRRKVRADLVMTHYLGTLAEIYLAQGRLDEALRLLDEADGFAERNSERFWSAELLRLRGELAQQAEASGAGVAGFASAQSYLEQALATAREQRARTLELRAACSLARLWLSQGRASQARSLLEPLVASFAAGASFRELQEARALLSQLAGP